MAANCRKLQRKSSRKLHKDGVLSRGSARGSQKKTRSQVFTLSGAGSFEEQNGEE